MASVLAAPMKRLLDERKITREDVKKRVKKGIITELDYKYITGEKYSE